MAKTNPLHCAYCLFNLSQAIMYKQPVKSRVDLLKLTNLFKMVLGLSILYLGAILLFAKLLHTLLQT